MASQKLDSMMKETLESLCCSNGWCYGVFWGFHHRNSSLLTLKDAYHEEQMGALIDSILLQAHVVGRGVIGQAAFAKNHRWIDSDAHRERQNCVGSFDSLEVFQEDSEFFCQFSIGIKTIAVISVEPWGVVEFGSTQKKPEMKDFVDQVQLLFRGIDEFPEIEAIGNEPHSDSSFFHSSMELDSVLSSGIFDSQGFVGADHSFVLPSQPFPSTSDSQSRNLIFQTSSSIENPIQSSSNPLDQLLLESGNFFDYSATHQDLSQYSDCSLLTSSWPHLASGLENSVSFSESRGPESCQNSSFNTPVKLSSTSLQGKQFSKDMSSTTQNLKADERLSGLLTVEEFFVQSNFAKAVSKTEMEENDFSQWISPHTGNTLAALVSTDMLHSTGLLPGSSLSGSSTPIQKLDSLPTNSLQSSVTYAFRSSDDVKCSGIERQLDTMGVEQGRKKPIVWNGTLIPESECISEKNVGPKISNSNSLFSKLGLDQLLDGIASASPSSYDRSRFEDQSSSAAKRRKLNNSSWSQNQVKFEGSSFDGKMKSTYSPEAKNAESNSEDSTKELRSCIGDSSAMDAGKTSSSMRQEEVLKTKKKKAKPGTRPRPKDRQMIQDRLAELRELIPNGEKMSIDRLLERTIRHLNFMQSLTRHAESLKQTAKPKSMEVLKNHSINGGDGVTWAYEVGDDAMVCPLIVEDLSTPGQMLIEILCEEQGFFLEIVEIIRGFGLTILNGVMEIRETKKIWAHFMVEAEGTRCVTRHEIFATLIQLLQMTGQSAVNEGDGYGNVISPGMPAFNSFQPTSASFSVNFTDVLQCASL